MYRHFLLVIFISFLFSCAQANNANQQLAAKHLWQQDLAYLHQELERRHFNLYHTKSKAELTQELNTLSAQADELTQEQFLVRLMKIVQSIGDGHTLLSWNNLPIERYPIKLKYFTDNHNKTGTWRVIATSQKHKELLGLTLSAINQQSVTQVAQQVGDIAPTQSETSAARIYATAQAMTIGSVLKGLGIASDKSALFKFTDEQGQVHQEQLQALSEEQKSDWIYAYQPLGTHPYSMEAFTSTNGLHFYLDEQRKTAFIDFNHYPGYWDMFWFARKAKASIQETDINNLVIDLRDNRGGDFYVGLMLTNFLLTIDSLNWQDGIYVLINEGTYSAAGSNAMHFRQILNAQLVGSPTGGTPNGIQDLGSFTLPNLGWSVKYSKRKFRFTQEVTDGIQPDIMIRPKWTDYQNRIDNEMQWVISDITNKTSD